jgi:hypothetical protein
MAQRPDIRRDAAILGPKEINRIFGMLKRQQVLGVGQQLDGHGHGLGKKIQRAIFQHDIDILEPLHPLLAGDAFHLPDLLSTSLTGDPYLRHAKTRRCSDGGSHIEWIAWVV